ncbi:Ribonuclease P protein component [Agreia sp. COWG]|nr:ribonuclease P protein component [Agreia sp. COWG]CAD6011740.1 Ribonuclease P protein component [Agreia sp. COWG]
MLAHANRITTADDYRGVVRRGSRFVSPNAVTYLRVPKIGQSAADAPRFGFIVAKSVGIAVTRNKVRRRLKAASYSILPQLKPGTDVVIRALPGAASQPYGVLCQELVASLRKGSALA